MPAIQPYTDHLGQEFPSMSAMAKHWEISNSTLQRRLKTMQLSVKQALTLSTEACRALSRNCTDHTGRSFASKADMCKHWKIPSDIYFSRLGIGWSQEKALTTPVNSKPKNAKEITDHEGNRFLSISDMCKHWNMTRSTYNARIKSGWSAKDALTTPQKQVNITKQTWQDHLGNQYESLNQMCKTYGITHHTFYTRLNRLGWTLEKSLTTPQVINSTECTDNMGHIFPTLADMSHYYHIPAYKLQGKSLSDEELQKCLTSGFSNGMNIGTMTIKQCIEFPYYLVKQQQHEIVVTFNTILQEFHNHNFTPIPNGKLQDKRLSIHQSIEFPYYEVLFDGQHEIWSYWQIIQYRKESNFGISVLSA